MFYESIQFQQDMPLAYEGWQVGSYHLHAHKDVIEVLMVVKGKATLTVSCETFEMTEGDYVVIRERDSHQFSAAGNECEIVSLYIDMKRYVDDFPHIYYVLFGCESFDLAKYRNESGKIRKIIVSILGNLIPGLEQGAAEARREADSLMWILVNDYDMIKYYNRKWDAPFSRVEKYYKIMRYVFEHYDKRDILDFIADEEHYSKTTITHLVKDVGGTSLKDMLDYVRLFQAEKLLILTSQSILEISDRCGFSDVKYFTQNFKKWYACTPSEYRRRAVQDNSRKSIFINLTPAEIYKKIQRLGCRETSEDNYKASVNPISTKVFGYAPSGQNPLGGLGDHRKQADSGTDLAGAGKHRMIVAGNLAPSQTDAASFPSATSNEFGDGRFQPVCIVDLRDKRPEAWSNEMASALGGMEATALNRLEVWVLYGNLSDHEAVQQLIEGSNAKFRSVTFIGCCIPEGMN